jgi:hypothetical protein
MTEAANHRKTGRRAFAALLVASAAFGLAACSAEPEETVAEEAAEPDAAPLIADAEAGRPFFDEAMNEGCADAAVGRVECSATSDENRLSCEYELLDGEPEVRTVDIIQDGDTWTLAETPDHCTPADAQG